MRALQKFKVSCKEEAIRQILSEHLKYRRSDGVCWTIYLAYLAGKNVGSKCIRRIVASGDCMAMACLLGLGKGRAAITRFLETLIASNPTDYELDRYWLLILEISAIDSAIRQTFNAYLKDTRLTILMDHNVSFLRKPSIAAMKPKTCCSARG